MADVNLTIDGLPVTAPAGTLLVEAAKTVRTDIPVYCYHPKLGPAGLCRICLVDVEKTPKLQIACNTTVAEGMVVNTMNERSMDGRRAVLAAIFSHALDRGCDNAYCLLFDNDRCLLVGSQPPAQRTVRNAKPSLQIDSFAVRSDPPQPPG